MVLAVLACVLLFVMTFFAVGRSLESGEWEGFVTLGSGGDSFRPCGSRETWWVKSKGFTKTLEKLKMQYKQVAERPYDPVYLSISGEVSKKGQFGPLGSYQRVIYIVEVLEIRPAKDDDCRKH